MLLTLGVLAAILFPKMNQAVAEWFGVSILHMSEIY